MNIRAVCGAVLMLFVASVSVAHGQKPAAFPTRIVRFVVPFTAGSMSDLLGREVAAKLSEKWKQPVIIENRPGLAGTAYVAKVAADGYTLLLTSNAHLILNRLNPDLPFDAVKDFKGVSLIATVPLLVVVPKELPVSTLKDFVTLVRSKPGAMNYAAAGIGSTSDLAAKLFLRTQNLEIVQVPYKGAPDAYTSVIQGDTQVFFAPSGVGDDLIADDKVKALAVSGSTRLPKFPNVPTFAEAGAPDAAYEAWFGLLAPVGVPDDIVEQINRAEAEVVALPNIRERFAKQGAVVATESAAEFSKFIQSEATRLGQILDDSVK